MCRQQTVMKHMTEPFWGRFRPRILISFIAIMLLGIGHIGRATSTQVPVHEVFNGPSPENSNGNVMKLELHRDLILGKDESDDTNMLFGNIEDITVDSAYSIYVVDRGFGRVQVYDSSGSYVRTLGRQGEGPGEYRAPSAVALDEAGNIYVAAQRKILRFDKDGHPNGQLTHGITGYTRDIQVTAGTVYISSFDLFSQLIIHEFDWASGRELRSFCDSYAVGQHVDTRVEMVCAGGELDIRDNLLYYTQSYPYEIELFSLNGEVKTVVYRNNDFVYAPDVSIQKDGSMHFDRYGASIAIVALHDGRFLNIAMSPHGDNEHQTVIDAFDATGHLIATKTLLGRFPIACCDDRDRLYGVDLAAEPKVVRYIASFVGSGY